MTKEQRDCLNHVLVLSKDDAALVLPAQLGVFIWTDLDACSAETSKVVSGEKSIEAAATDFTRCIPNWLRYASDAFMLKDFKQLLSFYMEHRHHKELVH